ncbi:hypothetical protein A4X13_0g9661, partial [Tilletia indica]
MLSTCSLITLGRQDSQGRLTSGKMPLPLAVDISNGHITYTPGSSYHQDKDPLQPDST